MEDDPFWFVYTKSQIENAPCARYIQTLETYNPEVDRMELTRMIRNSSRTKFQTYCTINPTLTHHDMYDCQDVHEHHRIAVA